MWWGRTKQVSHIAQEDPRPRFWLDQEIKIPLGAWGRGWGIRIRYVLHLYLNFQVLALPGE